MPLNPFKLFVVNALTRRDIALAFSEIRECCGYEHPVGPQEIAEDDDRLTDAICQEYADALGEIDYSDSEEFTSQTEQNAVCDGLEAMGYIQCESSDDEVRQSLLNEIQSYESLIEAKRQQLAMLGD